VTGARCRAKKIDSAVFGPARQCCVGDRQATLARIVYLALKHGMTYVRRSQEEYQAQMKDKLVKALKRKARQLGLEVTEKTLGGAAMAAAASTQG
jgi:hypothetical protein